MTSDGSDQEDLEVDFEETNTDFWNHIEKVLKQPVKKLVQ